MSDKDVETQKSHSVLGSPRLPDDNIDDGREYIQADVLARRLSGRQVQMIAIGGTIGTGLFLGTGKSLATGGPASMLIAYMIVGAIVFVTMLSLGEMAAFVPVSNPPDLCRVDTHLS